MTIGKKCRINKDSKGIKKHSERERRLANLKNVVKRDILEVKKDLEELLLEIKDLGKKIKKLEAGHNSTVFYSKKYFVSSRLMSV